MGAIYLASPNVYSRNQCMEACCTMMGCNLAVFENRNSSSCWLFDCQRPSVCIFTEHADFDIMERVRHHHNKHHQHQLDREMLTLNTPAAPPHQAAAPATTSTTDTPRNNQPKPDKHLARGGCRTYEWSCADGEDCIPIYDVCDGIEHCSDGSDEKDCEYVTLIPPSRGSDKSEESIGSGEKPAAPLHLQAEDQLGKLATPSPAAAPIQQAADIIYSRQKGVPDLPAGSLRTGVSPVAATNNGPIQQQQPAVVNQQPAYQPQQPIYQQPQQPAYQQQQPAYQPKQPVYQAQQPAYQLQQPPYPQQQPVAYPVQSLQQQAGGVDGGQIALEGEPPYNPYRLASGRQGVYIGQQQPARAGPIYSAGVVDPDAADYSDILAAASAYAAQRGDHQEMSMTRMHDGTHDDHDDQSPDWPPSDVNSEVDDQEDERQEGGSSRRRPVVASGLLKSVNDIGDKSSPHGLGKGSGQQLHQSTTTSKPVHQELLNELQSKTLAALSPTQPPSVAAHMEPVAHPGYQSQASAILALLLGILVLVLTIVYLTCQYRRCRAASSARRQSKALKVAGDEDYLINGMYL